MLTKTYILESHVSQEHKESTLYIAHVIILKGLSLVDEGDEKWDKLLKSQKRGK